MATIKDRAFELFDERGPMDLTAEEWAAELDTDPDYVYDLRREWRESRDDPDQRGAGAAGEGVVSLEPSSTDPGTTEGSTERDPDPDLGEDAGRETDGGQDPTDSVDVGHQGTEKLSPAGHEDESVSSIDAPAGVNLPEGTTPDDLEPDEGDTQDQSGDGDDSTQESQAPEPDDSGGENQADNSSGGLLSRIRGSSDSDEGEPRSTEEIVEDADTEEERNRREDLLAQLEASDQGEATDDEQAATGEPDPKRMQNGLVVDENLVSTLFQLPFSQAAQVTGWDGWDVSDPEAEANAELIVAYCNEQDIDLSTGSMLAMSLMSTVGGRAAGYAKHRRNGGTSADATAVSDPVEEPEPDTEPAETEHRAPEEDRTQATETVSPDEPTSEQGQPEAVAEGGDGFDFHDPDTWG
jgi:hypothetical protein